MDNQIIYFLFLADPDSFDTPSVPDGTQTGIVRNTAVTDHTSPTGRIVVGLLMIIVTACD